MIRRPRSSTLFPYTPLSGSPRRAYRPSDVSGDRRDGLSTTPLALASASTPLALCQTWPPRRRIRPHSATPWPARPAPAAPGPATPQSVLPRWCTSPPPLPNGPNFPAAMPRCDSRSSASDDTPQWYDHTGQSLLQPAGDPAPVVVAPSSLAPPLTLEPGEPPASWTFPTQEAPMKTRWQV